MTRRWREQLIVLAAGREPVESSCRGWPLLCCVVRCRDIVAACVSHPLCGHIFLLVLVILCRQSLLHCLRFVEQSRKLSLLRLVPLLQCTCGQACSRRRPSRRRPFRRRPFRRHPCLPAPQSSCPRALMPTRGAV